MSYKEIDGNLITLAEEGKFDVITHGCNCFNTMGAGIAPQMAAHFDCNVFPLEHRRYKGDYNKLGQIDWEFIDEYNLYVVNSYTQYHYGYNHLDGVRNPFDYLAFTLCMKKINYAFQDMHIGLPKIGAGLAGGDWNKIIIIIESELKDCDITIVNYKK